MQYEEGRIFYWNKYDFFIVLQWQNVWQKFYAEVPDPVISCADIGIVIFQSYYHPMVTVAYNGREIRYEAEELQKQKTTIRIPAQKDGICIQSLKRQDGAPVYHGSMELIPDEQGILLVNELCLEEYLKGVVPSEMPSSYSLEALKAQAVCARTYAWKQIQEGRLTEYDADVDDSVSFQVYGNVRPQDSTTHAVEETKGQIICQNGEAIDAYYFSTSAGVTSTDEIWGAAKAASYLKSVPCKIWWTGNRGAAGPIEIPWENIEKRAEAYQDKKDALTAITVNARNESGAVTDLTVSMKEDSFELKNEYEIRQFFSPEGCTITEKDGTETEGGKLLPSAYFELEMKKGESVKITGGGYGHGVGMSQTAANVMAEEGYDYRIILDYFFQKYYNWKSGMTEIWFHGKMYNKHIWPWEKNMEKKSEKAR